MTTQQRVFGVKGRSNQWATGPRTPEGTVKHFVRFSLVATLFAVLFACSGPEVKDDEPLGEPPAPEDKFVPKDVSDEDAKSGTNKSGGSTQPE